MEEKKENSTEIQTEQKVYQTELEEPQERVETFSNKTITPIKSSVPKNQWLIIGVIIIGILITAGILFSLFKNNSKYILVKSLDTWSSSLEKITKHVNQTNMILSDEETVKVSGKMNIEAPILLESMELEERKEVENLFALINKLKFNMDVRTNREEKLAYVGLKGNLEDDILFDLELINQDNHQYLLLRNVLERYLDLGEYEMFKEESEEIKHWNEESKYVWNVMKKSLQKNLKSSYIKRGNEKILIDGKKITTKTTTLVLNEKNVTELMFKMVKDLQKNKRTKKFLTSLYPSFEDYEVTISDNIEDPLLYTVYTKNGEVVRISFASEENEFHYIPGKTDIFEFVENHKVIMHMTLSEKKNGFQLIAKDPNNDSNKITLVQKVESNQINYQFDLGIGDLALHAFYINDIAEIQKKQSYKMDIKLLVDMKYQDVEAMKIGFDMTASIENKTSIEPVKDSVLLEDITEEEQKQILFYLENMIGLLGLN